MLRSTLDKTGCDWFLRLDSKVALPLLEQAKIKIPVVAFDSGVEGDIPVATAQRIIKRSLRLRKWLD